MGESRDSGLVEAPAIGACGERPTILVGRGDAEPALVGLLELIGFHVQVDRRAARDRGGFSLLPRGRVWSADERRQHRECGE